MLAGVVWGAVLTQGHLAPTVLQHHIPVQEPLGGVQQLPFFWVKSMDTSSNNTDPCNGLILLAVKCSRPDNAGNMYGNQFLLCSLLKIYQKMLQRLSTACLPSYYTLWEEQKS